MSSWISHVLSPPPTALGQARLDSSLTCDCVSYLSSRVFKALLLFTFLNHWSTGAQYPLLWIFIHFFPTCTAVFYKLPLWGPPFITSCTWEVRHGMEESWASVFLISLLPTRPAGLLSVSPVFQWDWLNMFVTKVLKAGAAILQVDIQPGPHLPLWPDFLPRPQRQFTWCFQSPQCPPVFMPLDGLFLPSVLFSPLPVCWNSICLPWPNINIVASAEPSLTPAWEVHLYSV